MAKRAKTNGGDKRDRQVPVSAEQIKAFSRSASLLSSQLAALVQQIENDDFSGSFDVDGGQLIGDLLERLHKLCGKMVGSYYGSITAASTASETVPESVPDPDSNTRNGASKSQELSQPEEATKRKKSP